MASQLVQPFGIVGIDGGSMMNGRTLGLDDTVGSLGPGMAADIVRVEGKPLEDLIALQRVRFVMKEGMPAAERTGSSAERAGSPSSPAAAFVV